jgi:NosR/NirI family transcriptional regulator, nitrous oxide reductase regulator
VRTLFNISGIAAVLLLMAGSGFAESRFPKPDFDSGYQMPQSQHPLPQAAWLAMLDAGVLAVVLAAGVFFAVRVKSRSRRGIAVLSVFSLLYFGFWRKGCVCAVGSLQNAALAMADSTYVLPLTVLLIFVMPLVFALFFGRIFCGVACPLGMIQDVVAIRPVRVPRPLAAALGFFRYVYLAFAILLAASGATFLICRYDPFVPFFRLSGPFGVVLSGFLLLLIGVWVARPYCRFICPYSILLEWASRLSWRHLRVTPDECIDCRLCEHSCPYDAILEPVEGPDRAQSAAGIRRLAMLVVLVPLFAAAGGWIGWRLPTALSLADPVAVLAEQVREEQAGMVNERTLESRAFRSTGRSTEQLFQEVRTLRQRLKRGGIAAGGFIGLMLGIQLAGLSLWRRRKGYEPDRGACLSCGRCFEYCPRERLRRSGKKKSP